MNWRVFAGHWSRAAPVVHRTRRRGAGSRVVHLEPRTLEGVVAVEAQLLAGDLASSDGVPAERVAFGSSST
jgi:hypothetical protein